MSAGQRRIRGRSPSRTRRGSHAVAYASTIPSRRRSRRTSMDGWWTGTRRESTIVRRGCDASTRGVGTTAFTSMWRSSSTTRATRESLATVPQSAQAAAPGRSLARGVAGKVDLTRFLRRYECPMHIYDRDVLGENGVLGHASRRLAKAPVETRHAPGPQPPAAIPRWPSVFRRHGQVAHVGPSRRHGVVLGKGRRTSPGVQARSAGATGRLGGTRRRASPARGGLRAGGSRGAAFHRLLPQPWGRSDHLAPTG